MIPKKIHYCWFGKGKMPELALKCIESWRVNLPDYELKECAYTYWDNGCREGKCMGWVAIKIL